MRGNFSDWRLQRKTVSPTTPSPGASASNAGKLEGSAEAEAAGIPYVNEIVSRKIGTQSSTLSATWH